MSYSQTTFRQAKDILQERKLNAEKSADKRKAEFFSKVPYAQELEKQISLTGISAARAVANGDNVVKQMKALRDKNLLLQNELKALYSKYNLGEEYFAPQYKCKICSDTGYIEKDGKTVMCSCFKNLLVQCACRELNRTAPLSLSTFESFKLDYYSKNVDERLRVSPYAQMNKILAYCKQYAENFSASSESILMKGATGLGKTHLSLAIANEVLKKGYGVIYSSAPILMNKLEKSFFSRTNDDDSAMDFLLDCDLLIIDDLGTEFHGQFSVSQLYNIFNSRMLQNKPVIINTNLTMREMKEIYSDRFVSRLCGNAQKLDFMGKDIRTMK